MADVVVGIDASTTSLKAIAFDRQGRELFQARESYPLQIPSPGHCEQDPEDWWTAFIGATRAVAAQIGAHRIAGLAIAHQRETFTLLDDRRKALVPAILWLDERARPQVARLAAELGRDRIRDSTGKPPDPTPALYALAWLTEHKPHAVRDAVAVVDVNAYLTLRLTGELSTSTASADPLGFLDLRNGEWDSDLVRAAGLRDEQLPRLENPGALLGEVSAAAAQETGLRQGTPLFAGAGDGQAMGLGMGVVGPGKSYLSLGSGIVGGTYSPSFVSSDAFRTLIAPSGGFMLETVLRSGMQLVEWMVRTIGNGRSIGELDASARTVPAGSGNLLVLPYWAGVMSPYWDEAARGAVFGLSLATTPDCLFRACLEGMAFEQAMATEALEKASGSQGNAIVAAGGGTQSRLLMDIMASVLERPLSVSPVNEAAALGAAMLAATGAGWYPDVAGASTSMVDQAGFTVDPVAELTKVYRPRMLIYRSLYQATKDVHQALAALD